MGPGRDILILYRNRPYVAYFRFKLGRLAQLVERPLDVRKVQRFEPSIAHK